MNTFVKENKKLFIVVGLIILVLIIGLIISLIVNSNSRSNEEVTAQTYDLSSITYVTEGEAAKYPITYDYITGHIGNYSHDKFNRADILKKTTEFIILLYKEKDHSMFVSYYGAPSTPLLIYTEGFKPQQVYSSKTDIENKITNIERDSMLNYTEDTTDGKYTYYLLNKDNFEVNLSGWYISFEGLESSYSYEQIQSQSDNIRLIGYDPQFIRKYPELVENWEKYKSINIFDNFWDNVRPEAVYVLHHKTDKDKKLLITFKGYHVSQTEQYSINYSILNIKDGRSKEEWDEILLNWGYESVNDAIANGQFATQQEYTDVLNTEANRKSKW